MERVEGTSLRHLDLDEWTAADRVTLANRITQTWMQMVFMDGFFHADPHRPTSSCAARTASAWSTAG